MPYRSLNELMLADSGLSKLEDDCGSRFFYNRCFYCDRSRCRRATAIGRQYWAAVGDELPGQTSRETKGDVGFYCSYSVQLRSKRNAGRHWRCWLVIGIWDIINVAAFFNDQSRCDGTAIHPKSVSLRER